MSQKTLLFGACWVQPMDSKTNTLFANLQLSYKLLKGLSISTSLGYTISNNSFSLKSPIISFNPKDNPTGVLLLSMNQSGNASIVPQVSYNTWLFGRGDLKIEVGAAIRQGKKENLSTIGMGYTSDGRLIVMVIQGRFPGIADGVTLTEEAQLLKDLGCVEALNLDGGGSSCMLINGKETIKPSDKEGERPVPAVFVIKYNPPLKGP